MIESFSNKILFVLFFISFLNVGRHVWKIFMMLRNQDLPNKYELSKRELVLLGISVSYILTTIFTGIKI